jgi:hypothetical protein
MCMPTEVKGAMMPDACPAGAVSFSHKEKVRFESFGGGTSTL